MRLIRVKNGVLFYCLGVICKGPATVVMSACGGVFAECFATDCSVGANDTVRVLASFEDDSVRIDEDHLQRALGHIPRWLFTLLETHILIDESKEDAVIPAEQHATQITKHDIESAPADYVSISERMLHSICGAPSAGFLIRRAQFDGPGFKLRDCRCLPSVITVDGRVPMRDEETGLMHVPRS